MLFSNGGAGGAGGASELADGGAGGAGGNGGWLLSNGGVAPAVRVACSSETAALAAPAVPAATAAVSAGQVVRQATEC